MEIFLSIVLHSELFTLYRFEPISDQIVRNDAYCQNIYWQPESKQKMDEA